MVLTIPPLRSAARTCSASRPTSSIGRAPSTMPARELLAGGAGCPARLSVARERARAGERDGAGRALDRGAGGDRRASRPAGRSRGVRRGRPRGPRRRPTRVRARRYPGNRRAAHLVEALRQTGGNVTRAAARLGISRDTLRYRMEKHGLTREGPERPPRQSAPGPHRPAPVQASTRAGDAARSPRPARPRSRPARPWPSGGKAGSSRSCGAR